MSENDLNSLAILHTLRALAPAEEEKFRRQLATDNATASVVSEWCETAALLAFSLEPIPPPLHIREALLTAIGKTTRSGPTEGVPEIRVLDAGVGWENSPIKGIRFKRLSATEEGDSVTVLMSIIPGGRYPAHEHTGPEQCLVVSGSFESGGQLRQAGDFLYAETGTSDEELFTRQGVTLLVVMAREDFARAI